MRGRGVNPRRINADKPHLWKGDIAASVDRFNNWFIRFAPRAFRSTRVQTTERVKSALEATHDLCCIYADTLKANPGALPTLRMCTAPPLAVDRLIGLAGASKNLVKRMEQGKLPARIDIARLDAELTALCRVISELLDRDIFPWLANRKGPTDHERERALTIVADRLCSAAANDIVRDARMKHQLSVMGVFLESRGCREVVHSVEQGFARNDPGTYTFNVSIPLAMGRDALMPFDCLIQPTVPRPHTFPVLLDVQSAATFAAANARAAQPTEKVRALRMTYGEAVPYVLMLGGFFDAGYLGIQAAEGVDWVWQHRVNDLGSLGV